VVTGAGQNQGHIGTAFPHPLPPLYLAPPSLLF